jgi:hypothetical protein
MAAGLFGSALSPYLINLSQIVGLNPIASCSLLGIPVFFLCFLLKET